MSYRRCVCLFVLLAMLSATSSAGMVGGQFQISNSTIDGGGDRSTGGQFVLSGTPGQPDADLQSAAGGAFQISGGFWANGTAVPPISVIFKDSFEGP